jgi:hypothetical protein
VLQEHFGGAKRGSGTKGHNTWYLSRIPHSGGVWEAMATKANKASEGGPSR